MQKMLTAEELGNRMNRFRDEMDKNHHDWDTVIIVGNVNQYYFTGTMQDGMLLIRRGDVPLYFVRRSFERALSESPLDCIRPMKSYRQAAEIAGSSLGCTYLEAEIMPIAMLGRMQKTFSMEHINSVDGAVLNVRAIKSSYELDWMRYSGTLHDRLTYIVPGLLREGMTEADLVAELFETMMKMGYQGISRFSSFQTEMVVGQIGFGESSLFPTSFDGPGGAFGMYPAVPIIGSRERKLTKGDLVFVDIGFGINGYHTDKTQVYMFGKKPDPEVADHHRMCMEIQKRLAEKLVPGAVPEKLYDAEMALLSDGFKLNFMGFGARQVKFLGHGIGLHVDEPPAIAHGITKPLAENMVMALEPKKGIEQIGMVGVEDTYIVTKEGGLCITGGGRDIVVVD